jgi:hypothetical protein
MRDPFSRLESRVESLGNYNRKYLHNIAVNKEQLTEALERHRKSDQVHLWSPALNLPTEMDIVSSVARDRTEKLNFLGCYYALQFLHTNLRTVDVLNMEMVTDVERIPLWREFMLEAGHNFRYMTKNYMERLLGIFIDLKKCPRFVVLGVGTRADQDDIDVGVVDDGTGDREMLNFGISKLAGEMLKKASRLHFHLSEHVGSLSHSATIQEYHNLLEKEIGDFVIITEMLGAAPILGDAKLFEEFKRKITSRYFYHPDGRDNRHHEGYLRGMLGELRSLQTRLKPAETISPKEDGLRLIKGHLSLQKTVYGVEKVNAWDLLTELLLENPRRYKQYNALEEALTFLEMFRYLYQLFAVQEEEIHLGEPGTSDTLERMASVLGYEKKGVVHAKDILLVNYYEELDRALEAVEVLTEDMEAHLKRMSLFTPMLSKSGDSGEIYEGNMAIDFLEESLFFRGITYWDDFLEGLEEGGEILDRFLEGMDSLTEKLKFRTLKGYIEGAYFDLASTVRLLVSLGRDRRHPSSQVLFEQLNNYFVEIIGEVPDVIAKLAHIFYAYPGLLNSYLTLLDSMSGRKFAALLEREVHEPEVVPVVPELKTLCEIHCRTSRYFKNHFLRIVKRYPLHIRNLKNLTYLKEIGEGFYGELSTLNSVKEKRRKLGDYYDLEFVRIALKTLRGAPSRETDADYTEFTDDYVHTLFELCKMELDGSLGTTVPTKDLLAIYAAGGHAREHAYDDDFDLVVLLNSEDEGLRDYCAKIVTRMNGEISKRGLLPHYRLADHFGSYVVTLRELESLLGGDSRDTFIDRSQLLGSRLLVGSGKFEAELEERIIRPHIFDRREEYISQMIAEIRSRHQQGPADQTSSSNLKETSGGLRDIEMVLLLLKAKYAMREPISRRLLRSLREKYSELARPLEALEQGLDFLKNLRDLYRLTVAADDLIQIQYLQQAAEIMGFGEVDDPEAPKKLFDAYLFETKRVEKAVAELIDRLSPETR